MANYKTEAEALAAAGVPGWRVTGREAEFKDVPNQNRTTQSDPATIRQRTGNTTLTVVSPDGKSHDTIVIGEADDPSVKGGKAITVVTGAQKNQPTTNQPSTPGGWTPVYRVPNDPSSGQIGQWDPVNNEFHPQAADPGAKPTGTYDNVVDPNDPKGKRVIGMVDKGDASWHAVSSDPNLPGRQIITTPTAVYAVDADNKVSKLVDIDKDSPFQAVIVDGKPFKFDPKTGTFTPGPVNEHPDVKDQNGLTMVWTTEADGSGKYAYPPGVKPAAGLSVNTAAPNLIWYDTEGNVVATRPNDNYRPPAPTLPQVGANAPMVPIEDPQHPGQIKWIPNQGQVMAGDALSGLAAQLTHTVVDPNHPLTLEQAKALIDSASERMKTEAQQAQTAAGAAQNLLTNQQQGAQTGAGLLQQRATTATNLVQQGLGMIGQGASRSGNYGGGLLSPVPGFGQALVQGAAGFATELGGGQAVFDTAVRMVQAADPNNSNPDRATAVATLTQLMDRYKQATGNDYPTVAATRAAQQSQQQNAFVPAPTTPAMPAIPAPLAQSFGGVGPWAGGATPPPGTTYYAPGYNPQTGVFTAPPLTVAQPRSQQELQGLTV